MIVWNSKFLDWVGFGWQAEPAAGQEEGIFLGNIFGRYIKNPDSDVSKSGFKF